MTYEEFVEKLVSSDIWLCKKTTDKSRYNDVRFDGIDPTYAKRNFEKVLKEDLCLHKSWVSGGLTGGSCWDDGEYKHTAVSAESEPEFDSLDSILEAICPKISFLQYKKLLSSIEIHDYNSSCYEYYGNYTEYTHKYICLKNLYEKMKELKFL